jgi:pimeloyl-ACP methyl ester carboxylesterase
VIALADGLNIERFAVLGYSGGGPYAVACAVKIAERLTTVGIGSGVGPHDVPGLTDGIPPEILQFDFLARDQPALARAAFEQIGEMVRSAPDHFIAQSLAGLPPPDKAVLAHPEVQQVFIEMVREALRAGPGGVQWDTALMVSPWDVRPQDIRMPVHLWYGDMDTHAPPAMGHYLAAAIPESHATFYPNEGHLSLIYNHAEGILGVLAA